MCSIPGQVPFLRIRDIEGMYLRWGEAVGADKYHIELSLNGNPWTEFPMTLIGRTISFPKPQTSKQYAFRIRASNDCGFGPYSPVVYRKIPPQPKIPTIKWITSQRNEPSLYGENTDYIKTSPTFEVDVAKTSVSQFYFRPETEVSGILIACNGTVIQSLDNGKVTLTIPSNSIIFGNAGTNFDDAVPKIFTDQINGITHTLDQSGIIGFAERGFKIGSFASPIYVQTLRKLGYINGQGILSFKFVHVVNGTGYAYVYASPNVTLPTQTAPPQAISASIVESGIRIAWDKVESITKVYKRIDNSDWTKIATLGPDTTEYLDRDSNPGVLCYTVCTNSLPNDQNKACVFVRPT